MRESVKWFKTKKQKKLGHPQNYSQIFAFFAKITGTKEEELRKSHNRQVDCPYEYIQLKMKKK